MGAGHGRLTAAAALLALAVACTGPRVRVLDAAAAPSPQPGHMRVTATVVNSGGEGDVKITARLRDRSTGRVVSVARSMSLRAHDTQHVVIDAAAPPGDYAPEVSAAFPGD